MGYVNVVPIEHFPADGYQLWGHEPCIHVEHYACLEGFGGGGGGEGEERGNREEGRKEGKIDDIMRLFVWTDDIESEWECLFFVNETVVVGVLQC